MQPGDLLRAAYDLQANEKGPEHSVITTMHAWLLVAVLHKMGRLARDPSTCLEMGEEEEWVGSLAHHFLLVTIDNCHEVVELSREGEEWSGSLDS